MSTDDEYDAKIFGARTQAVVDRFDLNYASFAKKVGISRPFASQVCNGNARPSFTMIGGLRRVFGVSLDWYILGAGPMFVADEARAMLPPPPPPRPPHELHQLVDAVLENGDPELIGEVKGTLRQILREREQKRADEQLRKSA